MSAFQEEQHEQIQHYGFEHWSRLPLELKAHIYTFLPLNERVCNARLVDKQSATICAACTVNLSEPVPHHAFLHRWGAPAALRCLSLLQRRNLLHLTSLSGSVANLEVLEQHASCTLTRNLLDAAVTAGRLDASKWLWDRGLGVSARTHARPDAPAPAPDPPLAPGGATTDTPWGLMSSAAASGNLDLCRWLHQQLLPSKDELLAALPSAARSGHRATCEWILDTVLLPDPDSNQLSGNTTSSGTAATGATVPQAYRHAAARAAVAAAWHGDLGLVHRLLQLSAPVLTAAVAPELLAGAASSCPLAALQQLHDQLVAKPACKEGGELVEVHEQGANGAGGPPAGPGPLPTAGAGAGVLAASRGVGTHAVEVPIAAGAAAAAAGQLITASAVRAAAASPTPDWQAKVLWLLQQLAWGAVDAAVSDCTAAAATLPSGNSGVAAAATRGMGCVAAALARQPKLCDRLGWWTRLAGAAGLEPGALADAAAAGHAAGVELLLDLLLPGVGTGGGLGGGGNGAGAVEQQVVSWGEVGRALEAAAEKAAAGGHVGVLRVLGRRGLLARVGVGALVGAAAERGRLEVARWLMDGDGATDGALGKEEGTGAPGAVESERQRQVQVPGPSWEQLLSVELMGVAAESGCMELVSYLYGKGCPWDEQAMNGAAAGGSKELLMWMAARGCPVLVRAWQPHPTPPPAGRTRRCALLLQARRVTCACAPVRPCL